MLVCHLIFHNAMSSFKMFIECFRKINVLNFHCGKKLTTVVGCGIVMKLLNYRNMLISLFS